MVRGIIIVIVCLFSYIKVFVEPDHSPDHCIRSLHQIIAPDHCIPYTMIPLRSWRASVVFCCA